MSVQRPAPLIAKPYINTIPPDLVSRFDPKYVEFYNTYNVGRLAGHQVPIEHYRKDPARYATQYCREYGGDVFRVSEQLCPVENGHIKIRIFEGYEISQKTSGVPAYINFHGGGWVFGDLETDDDFCRRVAREVGCIVFDVDYRLAPEFKFPIPIDDSWAAFKWIIEEKLSEFHLDPKRIAIGGVSAGGHISAILAQKARDENIPLAFQLLCVPVCDLEIFNEDGEISPECPYESYREMYDTVGLPTERVLFFHRLFLGGISPQLQDEVVKMSPIKAKDLSNLAPALVVTAEMDSIRDEGVAYFNKLKDAGCDAQHIMMKGVPHAFMFMDIILDAAKSYNIEAVKALKNAFKII